MSFGERFHRNIDAACTLPVAEAIAGDMPGERAMIPDHDHWLLIRHTLEGLIRTSAAIGFAGALAAGATVVGYDIPDRSNIPPQES